MNLKHNILVLKKIWLTGILFLLLFASFSFYVYSEKQIARAASLRMVSYELASELRQSSDDLTRMVRAYVVTGDPRYKEYYLDILNIRNGTTPRPERYSYVYWDFVLANAELESIKNEKSIPLLELMRQAGFQDKELEKMKEAKINSYKLAALELDAISLSEMPDYPNGLPNRAKALQMVFDENYLQAKTKVMKPINDFFDLMNVRTHTAINHAKNTALMFRLIFIVAILGTTIMLWRLYASLVATLGSSVKEIHALITKIGQGNFNARIIIPSGMEKSILANLLTMQEKLKAHEKEREKSEEQSRIAAICFESQEAAIVTDFNHTILRVNQAFTNITGYPAEVVVGQNSCLLNSDHNNDDFYHKIWDVVAHNGGWQGEIRGRRKNGEAYLKWLTISTVKRIDNAVTHYVIKFSDITEYKKSEEMIRRFAFFDQLTGLPNRFLLNDRLKLAMTTSLQTDCYGAILFIDLDNFKTLNDTLGHGMGDLLLKHVGQRLTACVRSEDTVSRMGGDEFVVMLTKLSKSESEARIQVEGVGKTLLVSLMQLYQLDNISYRISASIGATLFKGSHTPIEDLMKHADLAMYKSKEMGRNTFHFFDPQMEAHVIKRSALEKELIEGIDKNQFVLHYQAQFLHDRHLVGVEALVRWQHPNYGLLTPDHFISIAEETRLILPLGYWIIETACLQLTAWGKRPEMAHLTIAVNISISQFQQDNFVEQILFILKKTGANPHRLKIELTESLFITKIEEVIGKMRALEVEGVSFSLDDFGVGFSSLYYLKRLPLRQLKIDQSFVRDVLKNPNDASIVRAIISLAKSLDLSIIAEGVETEAQIDFLAQAGCFFYQGFFFCKPLPLEDFEQFMQQQNKAHRRKQRGY